MEAEVLNSVARYLSHLDETQRAMRALFARKRIALRDSDSPELLQVADEEAELVRHLQQHLEERERILQSGRSAGFEAESIKSLLNEVDREDACGLLSKARQLEATATELRRETWVQWIVAQRSYKQYANLLDRIAHRGKPAATYDRREKSTSGAGTLLDASA